MISTIVRDFQSVKEAKINIKGLTVLRGASNAGKSSYIKALYAATHNRFRIGCIRYGQEFTEVKLKVSDSPYLMTIKRRETGSPRISLINKDNPEDRESWSKLNRDLPNEVIDYLNFGYVNVSNSEKFDLNFFAQFQPPLLVGFSQKKIMDILSASKSVDDLNIVRKEVDIRRVKNSGAFDNMSAVIDETKANLANLEIHIKDLSDLDKVEPLISKLSEILERKKKLEELRNKIKFYFEIKKTIARLETLLELMSNKEELIKRREKLESLQSLNQFISKEGRVVKCYESLSSVLAEKSNISSRRDKVKSLLHHYKMYFYLKKNIAVIDEVYFSYFVCKESLLEVQDRKEKLNSLKKLIQDYFILKNEIKSLEVLKPKTIKVEQLRQSLKDFSIKRLKLGSLASELEMYESLKQRVSELKEIIDNNLCPYCGNKMDNHKH